MMMQDMKLDWLPPAMEETVKRIEAVSGTVEGPETLKAALADALGSKGKMYRPLLLLMCAGAPEHWLSRDRVISTAAAVELTHTASLIHDDVVDDAHIRRGAPTVQSKYGKHAAVYAGDSLLASALCDLLAHGCAESAAELLGCVKKMCAGEIAQMTNRWNTEVGLDAYFEAISGKTAALFATACRLGAREGGRSPGGVEALGRFGYYLGMLFQLNDDLNDWTSDSARSGKAVNMDFFDGIFTYPAISTFADPVLGPKLKALAAEAKRCGTSERLAERARRIVEEAGGLKSCEQAIEGYSASARLCLRELREDEGAVIVMADCIDRFCAARRG